MLIWRCGFQQWSLGQPAPRYLVIQGSGDAGITHGEQGFEVPPVAARRSGCWSPRDRTLVVMPLPLRIGCAPSPAIRASARTRSMLASSGACRARSAQRGRQPRSKARQASLPRAAIRATSAREADIAGSASHPPFRSGWRRAGNQRGRIPVGGGRHQLLGVADDDRRIPGGSGQGLAGRRTSGGRRRPGCLRREEPAARRRRPARPRRPGQGAAGPAAPPPARTGRPGRRDRALPPSTASRLGPHWARAASSRAAEGSSSAGAGSARSWLHSTAAAGGRTPHSRSAFREVTVEQRPGRGQAGTDQPGHRRCGIQSGIEERGQCRPGLGRQNSRAAFPEGGGRTRML